MFYILEGIDGAGCGAQRKNIEKKLLESGLLVETLKFPYYNSPIGRTIQEFQYGEIRLSVEMQFLAYASQMVYEKDRIEKNRREGILISDRYFVTTLAYQGLRGFPIDTGLRFAQDFKLEIPDKIFFLDTPPKIAFERKQREEGKLKLDINESNYMFLEQIDQFYRKLMKKEVLAPWISIDNTRSIDEVTDEIVNLIVKDLKNS